MLKIRRIPYKVRTIRSLQINKLHSTNPLQTFTNNDNTLSRLIGINPIFHKTNTKN